MMKEVLCIGQATLRLGNTKYIAVNIFMDILQSAVVL